jgi:phosphatidylserine/phosphatidylglycerophosphate/cardiolipin synthase-like enzyme
MSRRAIRVLALVFFLLTVGPSFAQDRPHAALPAEGVLEPLFAPWDDIESRLVEVIEGARSQVLVQAYLLTNKRIVAGLVACHRRGVDVQVLIDARQHAKVASSAAPVLAAAGIPVWFETRYENAHNKLIIIDAGTKDAIVVTGSFNFTWTAQHRNAENLLIVRGNQPLAARYFENWQKHKHDARPYVQ